MNKDLLSPFAVFAIVIMGAAFLIISLFVFITRGKSAFWTDKKMKVGGVILTLSSIVNCGCINSCQPTCYDVANRNGEPEVTCYDVAMTNVVMINSDSLGNVLIDNKITGFVESPNYEEYSYILINDRSKDTLQKGTFKLSENDTIPYERTFSIEITEKLTSGRYWIKIFNPADADDKYASPLESRQINIE